MQNRLKILIKEHWNYISSIRKQLHANPELKYNEYNTSKILKNALSNFNIFVRDGYCVTGLVAQINNNPSGKTIAIRADMDALSITEETNLEFSSKKEGVMHACGHDAHMAMVLGTAIVLNEIKDTIKGNIKFIFQPAEEEGYEGGAKQMVLDGALKNPDVDRILGMHVSPNLNHGEFAVCEKEAMASCDSIKIKITGKGGHIANPHKCINPVYVSAQFINNLLNLRTQTVDPFRTVIADISSIQTSTNFGNIIPNEVFMKGNVRAYDNEIREHFKKQITSVLNGLEEIYGIKYNFDYLYGYEPTINTPKVAEDFRESAKEIIGSQSVIEVKPSFAAEDFGEYLNHVPGAFGFLGVKKGEHIPLHNSRFFVEDESIMLGILIYCCAILDYLNEK